jgi:hypothetical protein
MKGNHSWFIGEKKVSGKKHLVLGRASFYKPFMARLSKQPELDRPYTSRSLSKEPASVWAMCMLRWETAS